jgi:hypothetical protein
LRLRLLMVAQVGEVRRGADAMRVREERLAELWEMAIRDDWHLKLVGSDVRELIGSLRDARAACRLAVEAMEATDNAIASLRFNDDDSKHRMERAERMTGAALAACLKVAADE